MRSKVYSDGSIKSLSSAESFVSAVASKDELVAFDVPDGPVVFKALVAPAVMSLYAEHMHESTCMNWRHNISEDLSRKCSLLKNLKVGLLRSSGLLDDYVD